MSFEVEYEQEENFSTEPLDLTTLALISLQFPLLMDLLTPRSKLSKFNQFLLHKWAEHCIFLLLYQIHPF